MRRRAPRKAVRLAAALAAAVVSSAAVALMACGGTDSEADRVRAVAQAYVDGFRYEDAQAVCRVVTADSRRQVVRESRQGFTTCFEALDETFASAPVQDFAQRPELGEPELSGGRAEVTVTSSGLQEGQHGVVGLVRGPEGWQVDMTAGRIEPPS